MKTEDTMTELARLVDAACADLNTRRHWRLTLLELATAAWKLGAADAQEIALAAIDRA